MRQGLEVSEYENDINQKFLLGYVEFIYNLKRGIPEGAKWWSSFPE